MLDSAIYQLLGTLHPACSYFIDWASPDTSIPYAVIEEDRYTKDSGSLSGPENNVETELDITVYDHPTKANIRAIEDALTGWTGVSGDCIIKACEHVYTTGGIEKPTTGGESPTAVSVITFSIQWSRQE